MNQIDKTGDGSHTLISDRFGVRYHSMHGAISESNHVFIEAGLAAYTERFAPSRISVLEYGLGTGLNALLAYLFAERHQIPIRYQALEKYPIGDQYKDLNYTSLLSSSADILEQIHLSSQNPIHIGEFFVINTIVEDFAAPRARGLASDVIFYDAFGPTSQPELWQEERIQTCFAQLSSPGVWVSYCAKGQVRRDLMTAGFDVERLPGPPGKREMLRAWKT